MNGIIASKGVKKFNTAKYAVNDIRLSWVKTNEPAIVWWWIDGK